MLNEGNRRDEYLEKKGESTKTTAMRKSSERRGRFSAGDTHQDTERENITWARPGTRPHADSLDRQRKGAHRMSRGRKKPQAGSSPEDRRWDAFVGDENKGKYQKLQDKKEKGQPIGIEAQKQSLLRKGERRRELRTQAVNAIRRAVGGGYVSEAKVDDYQNLSPIEKEFVRHKRQTGFEPSSDIDKHTETRRLVHREKRGIKKREPYRDGSSSVSGKYKSKSQNQKRIKELSGKKVLRTASNKIINFEREAKTFEEFMIEAYMIMERPYQIYGPDPHGSSDSESRPLGKPYKNKKRANTRADQLNQEIGGYRHFVRKVDEEFKDLTPEKEEKVKNRVGELARDLQVQSARMKELGNKPFGKYRPKVNKEKKAIVKSAKKKQQFVQNASDALIRTSVSREAGGRKRAEDLKQQLRDLGEEP